MTSQTTSELIQMRDKIKSSELSPQLFGEALLMIINQLLEIEERRKLPSYEIVCTYD